ncbi:hypothetical protein [Pseudomonas sp.]|uniref:hypothetical protein n=1 Tax=Pseudomonas sp. TaxID=306 RepID=UPI0026262AF4|nr:hypothetical protein [Pseudomonas sp.]
MRQRLPDFIRPLRRSANSQLRITLALMPWLMAMLQGHYAISLVCPVSRIEATQATIKQALADCQGGLTAALSSID